MIETSFMLHLRYEVVAEYKHLKQINLFDKNIFKRVVSSKDDFCYGYFLGYLILAFIGIVSIMLHKSKNNRTKI